MGRAVSEDFTQPATAFVDGEEAEILYAGPAPDLAEGVLQVNLRIPGNVQRGQPAEVALAIGDFRSQSGVTVAIAP